MRINDRRLTDANRVAHCFIGYVREIDQHSHSVHLTDDLFTKRSQSLMQRCIGRGVGPGERIAMRQRHVSHAQGVQPFAVEDCDPVYKDLYAMHAEYWQRCFDAIQPGRTVGEIDEFCRSNAAEILPAGSTYRNPGGQLAMHGRGLGSDGPLVTGGREQTQYDAVFTPGWAFVFKPGIRFEAGGRRYSGSWGDTVVVTEQGSKRLGKRPVGLMITGEPRS